MASWRKIARMALPIGVSLFFYAVPPQGRCAEDVGAPIEVAKEVQPQAAAVPKQGVEAMASYYAKRYKGRRTTSGERYRPEKLTGAHPTLPIGTRVRVTSEDGSREVIVTINDRCRKRRGGQVIDLSRAAARELGFLGKGKTKVRLVRLDEAEEPEVSVALPVDEVSP